MHHVAEDDFKKNQQTSKQTNHLLMGEGRLCYSAYVEVRGQPQGVSSILLFCGFWEWIQVFRLEAKVFSADPQAGTI